MAIKQRFTYFFAGDDIDLDVWQTNNITGTNTFAMDDTVNGGYKISTDTTSNAQASIDFNDIRPFDFDNSVFLATVQRITSANSRIIVGMTNSSTYGSTVSHIAYLDSSANTFSGLETSDGTSFTLTNSSIAVGTGVHNIKLELDTVPATDEARLTIDGILEVTHLSGTDNLPTTKLQPNFEVRSLDTTISEGRILNMEAYNS